MGGLLRKIDTILAVIGPIILTSMFTPDFMRYVNLNFIEPTTTVGAEFTNPEVRGFKYCLLGVDVFP